MVETTSISRMLQQAGLLQLVNLSDASGMSTHLTYDTAATLADAPDGKIFILAHEMNAPGPTHTHDYYEISYVMDGTVINRIDGRQLYMIGGSLCIMNLNSTHSLDNVDPTAVLVNIGLRQELFDEGVFHEFLMDDNVVSKFLRGETQNDYLFFTEAGNGLLSSSIVNMVEDYAAAGFRESYRLDAEVLLLLDTLSKTPSHSFTGIDRRALEMMEYIRENCATVAVGSLAREFGYSENYCSQYVKRHTGRTISSLITDARMEQAEEMLTSTDMSIGDIAKTVGYRSTGHFHENFKERHGITPSDYRKLGQAFKELGQQD